MTTNNHKKNNNMNPKPYKEIINKDKNNLEIGRIGKRYKNPKYSEAPPNQIGIDHGRWAD